MEKMEKMEKISSFDEILHLVDENVLVVLDIDDTILTINGAKEKAKHTDEEGLSRLLKKIEEHNSGLFFLTARHPDSKDYTLIDLKDINVPEHIEAFHCGWENKGSHLKYIMESKPVFKKYNVIIFVDDYIDNLYDVKQQFENKVKCFRFVIKNS
jgi:predicted enzyme involved in methoxymalonyl-ACP biosynthesis